MKINSPFYFNKFMHYIKCNNYINDSSYLMTPVSHRCDWEDDNHNISSTKFHNFEQFEVEVYSNEYPDDWEDDD